MQKSREIKGFFVSFIFVDYIPAWFIVLRIYVALVNWYMYFSQFVIWKQEITNRWNRSGEIGNRIPGILHRKQELDHYTITVSISLVT